ncbi:hypothetical protein CAF53_01565 [Sphingobium sp. LB126]|uniref:EAL domain-containing protein n=1 Tax=Sphingobium sp. LB126 TaxID=1983755 RepID=UPI000C202946|nr:EAL domain-containing protein [Sphingobium sp. LB126]PJG47064.1 hypothetical protein CAF53_01565 [Sphingobium sp. LB126]
MRDAVVVFDGDEAIFSNQAAAQLWGHTSEAMLGQDQASLWAPCDQGALRWATATTGGGPVRIRRADGSETAAILSLEQIEADGRTHSIALLRGATDEPDSQEQLRWLSLVINKSDRATILLDERRHVVHTNAAFTAMFGYSEAELVGRPPTQVLASDRMDRDQLAFVQRKAWDPEGFHHEFLASDKAGRDLWVMVTNHPIIDADGTVRHIACVAVDITRQKEIERLRQDVLEAITSDTSLCDIATFLCRRVEKLAPGVVASFLRVDAENRLRTLAAPSLPADYCAGIDGIEIGPDQGSCGTAAYRGEAVESLDIANDPRWTPYLKLGLPTDLRACWSSPIKRRDGQVVGTFAFYYREARGRSVFEDEIVAACLHLCMIAIERDAAKQQLARISQTDSLTGLPNRFRFQQDYPEQLDENDQSRAAFFVMDLDHLNRVNETLGHAAGDRMVVEAAARLQGLFRGSATVYRLLGDSFLVVLPGSNADRAAAAAEKIVEALAEPLELTGIAVGLSATIGISLAPANGSDRDTLVKYAGAAMSQGKANKRGTYRFFSAEMDQIAQERLHLTAALRAAVAGCGLELHYQPQVAIRTGAIHGVEALARWTDPDLGPVPPDKFIPLAEEIGLIEAIGEWSLRSACRQMATWRRAGVPVPAVSVNVSAPHFRNAGLPAFIQHLLEQYQLPPSSLMLEITESIMMEDQAAVLDTARAIRNLGVGLSLDDFGTGFSSLSRLTLLPITELKIDRSFMRDLDSDAHAHVLMTAVIRIGQSLGLTVVTEGIETDAQYDLLTGLGCDVAQGYLIARALSAPALADWLAARQLIEPTGTAG